MEFLKCEHIDGFLKLGYICDRLSENSYSSHKHTYWEKQNLKIICKITHTYHKKIYAGINEACNRWRKLQNNKSWIPSYLPGHREFKNFCLVSVAQTIWVSHAFVYGAVDINKLMTIFLTKPPSYIYAQSTTL